VYQLAVSDAPGSGNEGTEPWIVDSDGLPHVSLRGTGRSDGLERMFRVAVSCKAERFSRVGTAGR
jgi:hypothetical protein